MPTENGLVLHEGIGNFLVNKDSLKPLTEATVGVSPVLKGAGSWDVLRATNVVVRPVDSGIVTVANEKGVATDNDSGVREEVS